VKGRGTLRADSVTVLVDPPATAVESTLGILSFCHVASWKAASARTYELCGPMSSPARSKERDALLDTPDEIAVSAPVSVSDQAEFKYLRQKRKRRSMRMSELPRRHSLRALS
jgi:hypothetical protein